MPLEIHFIDDIMCTCNAQNLYQKNNNDDDINKK